MLRARSVAALGAALTTAVLVALPADAARVVVPIDPATAPPTCDVNRYRCPDMVARAPAELRVERTRAGRRILYATNRLDNVGAGRLEVRGRRASSRSGSMTATQVVRGRPGVPVLRHPAGRIVFKPIPGQGGYWKFSQALRFELRQKGRKQRLVRTGPKVVYCLRDLVRQPFRRAAQPRGRVFGACEQSRRDRAVSMGVSVGWRESYPAGYHEQYVDVTGLRGCFALWHVADPLNRLVEADETNNATRTSVRLPARVGRAPKRC